MFPVDITITQEMFDARKSPNCHNCAGALALKSIVGDIGISWGSTYGLYNPDKRPSIEWGTMPVNTLIDSGFKEVGSKKDGDLYSMTNCQVGDIITFDLV